MYLADGQARCNEEIDSSDPQSQGICRLYMSENSDRLMIGLMIGLMIDDWIGLD